MRARCSISGSSGSVRLQQAKPCTAGVAFRGPLPLCKPLNLQNKYLSLARISRVLSEAVSGWTQQAEIGRETAICGRLG